MLAPPFPYSILELSQWFQSMRKDNGLLSLFMHTAKRVQNPVQLRVRAKISS